jgi:hypothetical protein
MGSWLPFMMKVAFEAGGRSRWVEIGAAVACLGYEAGL